MKVNLEHHQQYLVEEFAEDYLEHRMPRRDLLRRVLLVTGSVPLSASVLLALGCGDSDDEPAAPPTATVPPVVTTEAGVGPKVSPSDPAIEAGKVQFPDGTGQVFAYLARPRAPGSYPGVLIVHENQGILEHFEDVARRFAKEGFVGLAIDLLSRRGGTAPDPMVSQGILGQLSRNDFVEEMTLAVNYLKAQSFVRAGAIGAIGYCFGGNQVWEIAMANPDIKAAAPYYGSLREELFEPLGSTRVAFMPVYGANDTRITGQAGRVEERLKASGRPYEIKIYEGAGHGFFNEDKTAYHQPSAAEAWKATLAWFRRHLTG